MRNGHLVFDCHTYIGKLIAKERFGLPEIVDARAMIELMDQAGVDKVFGIATRPSAPDYAEGNELIAKSVQAHPGRIYGYARINPHYGERAVQDLEYWIGERGLCGLKLSGLADGFVVNDKYLVWPLMGKAEELGIPVLMHAGGSWQCTPALIADLAMDFPRVNIIVAHMGKYGAHVEAIAFARRVKNLLLDTAFFGSPNSIRGAVATVGAEKVLYGSNAPYLPFEFEIDKIAKYALLSDEETRLVLGGNIARLLGVKL